MASKVPWKARSRWPKVAAFLRQAASSGTRKIITPAPVRPRPRLYAALREGLQGRMVAQQRYRYGIPWSIP